MAEVWKPQPLHVYGTWLDAIQTEASDKLTDWETGFIAQMEMRLGNGIQLTEGQAEKLEQIYAKYTS